MLQLCAIAVPRESARTAYPTQDPSSGRTHRHPAERTVIPPNAPSSRTVIPPQVGISVGRGFVRAVASPYGADSSAQWDFRAEAHVDHPRGQVGSHGPDRVPCDSSARVQHSSLNRRLERDKHRLRRHASGMHFQARVPYREADIVTRSIVLEVTSQHYDKGADIRVVAGHTIRLHWNLVCARARIWTGSWSALSPFQGGYVPLCHSRLIFERNGNRARRGRATTVAGRTRRRRDRSSAFS